MTCPRSHLRVFYINMSLRDHFCLLCLRDSVQLLGNSVPTGISRFTNAHRFAIKCGTDTRTLRYLCSTVLLVSLQFGCALATGNAEPVQGRDVSSLHAAALRDIEIDFSIRGNVVTVFGMLRNPVSLAQLLEEPHGAAEAFFREHAEAFGIEESMTFVPDRTMPMVFPRSESLLVRLRQNHAGVRVEGSWASVRYAQDATVMQATLVFDTDIQIESVKPKIDESRARALAVRHVKSRKRGFDDARVRGSASWEKPPELVIYSAERNRRIKSDLMAWVMEVQGSGGLLVVVLDANSGRLVEVSDHPQEANADRKSFNLDGIGRNRLPQVN